MESSVYANVVVRCMTFSTPGSDRLESWVNDLVNVNALEILDKVKYMIDDLYENKMDDTLIMAMVEVCNYDRIDREQPLITIFDREDDILEFVLDEEEMLDRILDLIAEE